MLRFIWQIKYRVSALTVGRLSGRGGNFGVSFPGWITLRLGMASGNVCAYGREERCGPVRVSPPLDSPMISSLLSYVGDALETPTGLLGKETAQKQLRVC